MSVKSIKLGNGISDPEFVEISTNARKQERAHLLGLLRILMANLEKESVAANEIYAAVELWIINREVTIREEFKQ
ncbi:TPA: hypothetical protein R1R37_001116 [Klebsiella aerogenes]|uniref:hypothetical protein n=1 Tax=Klebsiella aerogenes TaxID=548 RepID=UPI00292C780C|nr:hypothetical protein [Klebsiella aerogenes]HEC1355699.1 hypothetical protein [Klebsiella aerogenes]